MDYTLDSIVKEYLIENGDTQLNKYARIYQIAVSGLREFNMNSAGITKVIKMPIKVNDTCDLPLDYLHYKVIGLVGSDGTLVSLGRNDSLSLNPLTGDCGEPIPATQGNTDNPVDATGNYLYAGWGSDIAYEWRNSEFMGRTFGIKGGENPYGEYRIDRDRNLIILSGINNFSTRVNRKVRIDSVHMEYLADINAVDGDFGVHPFMVDALKNWIGYKEIIRDKTARIGDKDFARREYFTSARWAKKRFTSATLEEYKSAFRSGNTASVKW